MISRRITGRAAAMATITLLFAGAAVAAAGGVLPGPFSGGTAAEASLSTVSNPASSDAATTGSDVSDATSTDVTGTDGSIATSPLPEAHGLCTAWSAGHDKKADNPAFAKLQHVADEMHRTVDEYCTHVLDDKGDHDETDGTDVDPTDGTEVDQIPSTADTHTSGHTDNDHNGQSGHGHGPNG